MFKNNRFRHYLMLSFALAFVILLDYLGYLKLSTARQMIADWQAKNYASWQKLSQPILNLRQFWQLRQRLEDLEYRYREASVQLGELEALKSENAALKKLLENTDRRLDKTIISRPIASFAKPVLALDQAEEVMVGAMVLGEGSLLGRIEEINYGQARVILLKDMRTMGVLAKSESGVMGIVRGDGRSVLFSEIDSEMILMLNERVLTVGQEGIAPDILIGRIASIKDRDPAQATQEAIVEQAVNFYQLSLVEVRP